MRKVLISLLLIGFICPFIKGSVASDTEQQSYKALLDSITRDIQHASSDGEFSVEECLGNIPNSRLHQLKRDLASQGFVLSAAHSKSESTYCMDGNFLYKISW